MSDSDEEMPLNVVVESEAADEKRMLPVSLDTKTKVPILMTKPIVHREPLPLASAFSPEANNCQHPLISWAHRWWNKKLAQRITDLLKRRRCTNQDVRRALFGKVARYTPNSSSRLNQLLEFGFNHRAAKIIDSKLEVSVTAFGWKDIVFSLKRNLMNEINSLFKRNPFRKREKSDDAFKTDIEEESLIQFRYRGFVPLPATSLKSLMDQATRAVMAIRESGHTLFLHGCPSGSITQLMRSGPSIAQGYQEDNDLSYGKGYYTFKADGTSFDTYLPITAAVLMAVHAVAFALEHNRTGALLILKVPNASLAPLRIIDCNEFRDPMEFPSAGYQTSCANHIHSIYANAPLTSWEAVVKSCRTFRANVPNADIVAGTLHHPDKTALCTKCSCRPVPDSRGVQQCAFVTQDPLTRIWRVAEKFVCELFITESMFELEVDTSSGEAGQKADDTTSDFWTIKTAQDDDSYYFNPHRFDPLPTRRRSI